MQAEIIPMDSVRRSSLPSSHDEVQLRGFTKALNALAALKCCNMRETICAIENWVAAGMLSQAEADELMAWHGWGRG